MNDQPPEPDLRITVRPLPDGECPASIRVRQLLKVMLRRWGLRCLKVEWLDPGTGELIRPTQEEN